MSRRSQAYVGFLRRVLFPLHERIKGHQTFRMVREMERAQWLPPAQLREWQEQRLRALVTHACATVPYYAELFRQLGLAPHDIHTAADLPKLPLLSKEIIRENLERLKSRTARGLRRFATGGSTGQPLIFYLGPTRVSSDIAARWRAESWWGVGIGDREFVIWGSPVELTKQDRLRDLRDRIFRTRLLSAFEMSPEIMDRYLDELTRRGCRRVFGYPSSIALLCEHAQRRGRDLCRLGVRAVFVTAEYLWDHWRQTIAEAFGCPVVNGYGGRDSGFIAQECPAGGMHLTADRLLVEIVDEGGRPLPSGELGEIVVTHLDTPEMPFLRYRTGDMGTLGSGACACGRTLPLLARIEGRKTDFIVAPDGRILHGLSLIYVLRELEGIEQFRITQKALDEFEIELVRNGSYDSGNEARIREAFAARLRAPVTVLFRYSEGLRPAAGGKFRYVISEVAGKLSGQAGAASLAPAAAGWEVS